MKETNLKEYFDTFKLLSTEDKKDIVLSEVKQTASFIEEINKHYNIENISKPKMKDKDIDENEYLDQLFFYIEDIKENMSSYVNYNIDRS